MCTAFFCVNVCHWTFFFNAMSFAVQSSVCPPVTLSPCLCMLDMCSVWVWCVSLFVVCGVWLCCVLLCSVVVCRTHSQDHGIHIHTDVHVGEKCLKQLREAKNHETIVEGQ